jgi:hypothetical protein
MLQVLNFCFVFLEEKHGNGRQDNIIQVNNPQWQVKQKPEKCKKVKTLLCAAVGTEHHQHGFEACTVHGRSGSMSRNDTAVPNLSALNWLVKSFRCFHLTHQHKNGLSIHWYCAIHTDESRNANHKKELLFICTAALKASTPTLYSGGSKFNS